MSTAAGVLVVSDRDDLRAAIGRLAAATGLELVASRAGHPARGLTPGPTSGQWRSAAVVIVGLDRLGTVASAHLPRRSGVLVVTAEQLDEAAWRSAVAVGAEAVLTLPADERRLVDLVLAAAEPALRAGAVIGVIGGCGGSGASTLAAAVGAAAARSGSALLVDADPYGGGLDLLLAVEDRPGARWADLAGTHGRLHADRLRAALPGVDDLCVLSFGRSGPVDLPADAAAAVLDAGRRGFDYTIVDLPRFFDPGSALLAGSADLIVIVVANRVRAVAATAVLAAALASGDRDLRLVVRMCGSGQLLARDVTGAIGLPAVAVLRDDPAIAAAAERGTPPTGRGRGSLTEAAQAVLAAIATAPDAAAA